MKKYLFVVFVCIMMILTACDISLEAHHTDPGWDIPPETQPIEQMETVPVESIMNDELSAPIETEKYTVYWDDGKCYLKLSDESLSQAGESGTQNLISIPYPKFSSVAEMKKKLESGDLTDSEMAALMFKAKDQAKGVELVDIHKLYDLVFPEDLILAQVKLYGDSYGFEFAELAGVIFYSTNKEEFDRSFAENYSIHVGVHQELVSEKEIEDRNATVTYLSFNGKYYKDIRYRLDRGENRYLYILERYEDVSLDDDTSGSLYIIELYGEENGVYYFSGIGPFEERPSLEWISTFGLKEYEETDAP